MRAGVGRETASGGRNDLTGKGTTCGGDGCPVIGNDKGTQGTDTATTKMNRESATLPYRGSLEARK
jgi:hypothetical protein